MGAVVEGVRARGCTRVNWCGGANAGADVHYLWMRCVAWAVPLFCLYSLRTTAAWPKPMP